MSTVEYAAVCVLLAAALTAGGAALDAERLPAAVGAQLRRALCLVASGDCLSRAGPRPCVVGVRADARDGRVQVAVVQLGDGRTVVRETRADGSVRVTVVLASSAGPAVRVGPRVVLGSEAGLGFGRVFEARDAAAADALVARLRREDPRVGGAVGGAARFVLDQDADGEEAERFAELRGEAEAGAALQAMGLGGHAGALRGLAVGARVDRRTGARSVTLRLDSDVEAALSLPLARLGGGTAHARDVELAFGRDGRPSELRLRRTSALRGDARLGPLSSSGGDRAEVEVRLDLADPVARAMVGRALRGDAGAARDLAGRLDATARVDVRVFATEHRESRRGADLGIAGGEVVTSVDTARLVAAAGREPGLGWAPRLDCGLAA